MTPWLPDVTRLVELAKRPWDEITVVSAEGRDFRRAVNLCRARPAVAVRTAPGAGPAELARELAGWHRYLAVLENVGGATEQLSIVDSTEAERKAWRTPNLVLCLSSLEGERSRRWLSSEPVPDGKGWALPATAFSTREGHWIPEHIRALALARLAPRPGALLWDVCAGAGAGAVGIEAALLGAAVVAVERDAALCVRVVANANAHGVDVRLEDGELPRALRGLPRPDAVFLGRSTPELVRACAGAGAGRIVVLVTELDHLGATRSTLTGAGYAVDGCQLSAAPLVDGPDGGTAVRPAETSFLVWGARADTDDVE
jgi:precorrin-6Y C5,15-methyltransferase (decarboxylating)